MNNAIQFTLSKQMIENIETYSELLNKDTNTILNEALENYFNQEREKLQEKNIEDENAMTNLDFNEFWDDLDI